MEGECCLYLCEWVVVDIPLMIFLINYPIVVGMQVSFLGEVVVVHSFVFITQMQAAHSVSQMLVAEEVAHFPLPFEKTVGIWLRARVS